MNGGEPRPRPPVPIRIGANSPVDIDGQLNAAAARMDRRSRAKKALAELAPVTVQGLAADPSAAPPAVAATAPKPHAPKPHAPKPHAPKPHAPKPHAPEPAAPPPSAAPGPFQPALEYDQGRDVREDEPWFQQLPGHEQQRLRAQWQQKTDALSARRNKLKILRRSVVHGMLAFGVTALFQAMSLGFGYVPFMLVLGAAAGALWSCSQRGRFSCALIGGLVYMVGMFGQVFALGGGGYTAVLYVTPIILGALFVAGICGVIGMDREMRQSGGFGED